MSRTTTQTSSKPSTPTPRHARELELHHYRSDVLRYVSRLGVPKRVVEELTQDVFLVAYTRRETFRRESTLRTWLFGIAFHLVLNWRRRRCNRERCDERCADRVETELEHGWNDAAPRLDVFDTALAQQLCTRVAQTLAAQPEVAKQLWLMVTFEDMAIAAAARRLALQEDAAYQLHAKTTRRVRLALGNRASIVHTKKSSCNEAQDSRA